MCKFCEPRLNQNGVFNPVTPIYDDSTKIASLRSSNPISRRKNPEYPGFIDIAEIMNDSKDFYISIKYCPMCGRKL